MANIPKTMKAAVFEGPNKITLQEKPIVRPKTGEALLKVSTTTICGTDIHILKGEYPVQKGLTVGHEMVGHIVEMGTGVQELTGLEIGQRVITGAITPCGTCNSCQDGLKSQCGGKAMGGWKLGNTIDGVQAEYVIIPHASANLAPVPENLSDEQVLMCPDIMSTGFSGAERGDISIGDIVAVFAQGPIGLCATAGARLRGASKILVVDSNEQRLEISKKMGADVVINFKDKDPIQTIMELTDGRGVDVSIECLGLQQTFENCLRVLKPGGVLSSLGVYSGKLDIPYEYFAAGLGDHKIVTSLCPGGKERMRRLMNIVESGRTNLEPLVTHHYKLDQIEEAYDVFSNQKDGVLKVAIKP